MYEGTGERERLDLRVKHLQLRTKLCGERFVALIAVEGELQVVDLLALLDGRLFVVGLGRLQLPYEVQQAVALRALDEREVIVREVVVGQPLLGRSYLRVVHFASDDGYAQQLGIAVNVLRDDLRARPRQFVLDEASYVLVEEALANEREGHNAGRNQSQYDGGHEDMPSASGAFGQDFLMLLKPHQSHAQEGSRCNEHRINKEEIEGAEEEQPLTRGKSIARCTQWRHEGCGDGHARDDISFAACCDGYDTSCAAEEGDEHVVERWGGARQQFALRLLIGREQEVERGGEHADEGGDAEVLGRRLQQFQIDRAYGQTHAYDGAHQR